MGKDVSCPMQFVCNYLQLLKNKTINHIEPHFDAVLRRETLHETRKRAVVLPTHMCIALLQEYFVRDKKNLSYTTLDVSLLCANEKI